VYRKIDPALDHASATMPARAVGTENLAQGYQLLSESRYDELEPIVELLRKQCEQLQLPLRSMEVEMGPSQLEFTFDPDEPATSGISRCSSPLIGFNGLAIIVVR